MFKVITYLMILSLLVSGCVAPKKAPNMNSFAFIFAQSDKFKTCENGVCQEKMAQIAGSGIVFRKDLKYTYVITAGHVCSPFEMGNINFLVIDSTGLPHIIKDMSYSQDPDLCLIKTEGDWGEPVPLGKKTPKYGEKIYSMAAPRGIFIPNAVLVFDGNYSGRTDIGNDIFTLPCAPGSSGAAILNENGEIVSIVHSASLNFQNIAIGSNLDIIKIFLKEQENK